MELPGAPEAGVLMEARERPTRSASASPKPGGVVRLSMLGLLALAAASWGYLVFGVDRDFPNLLAADTWQGAGRLLGQMLGRDSTSPPAYTQWDRWLETGKLAYQTLTMSVLAIGLAGIGVLVTFLPAARNVSHGGLGGASSRPWRVLHHVIRLVYNLTRAVPELVWAMIIVFFLSPGLLPGAVALALHNFGIVGKLSAEVVENLDPAPSRALRAAGASNTQMLLYGILPQALPHFLTYLLYRWEVVIRTTVVVGFVAAGGMGREFRLSLSYFHYTDVALLLMWYMILVTGVDLLSALLRRMALPPPVR
ncbi:MAG: ABC transporter permease subunit [Dehalococcoidia bacterium]|nr:ABC transporter permease subunit [Dehalococcoidia bacterium]MSQ16131.1 ABC transporter permease subunit [Dehalococcoidia bacterium]